MAERLTLCAIVRDEEALLPACLASVRDAVDAIVVVDTGSTDRSVEIARGAGAKILQRTWSDDFAAARNAALSEVADGWVLVLDADERLVEGSERALRAAMAAGRVDWGLLALHAADSLEAAPEDVVAGRGRRGEPVLSPRLMRRTRELTWQGLVAEQPLGWRTAGQRSGLVQAPIVHYGAVPECRRNHERAALRLRLLQKRCELEPKNPQVRALLARETLRAGDEAAGREEAARAWHLLASATGPIRAGCDGVLVATLHAFGELAGGRLEAAAGVLARAGDQGWTHPNLDLLAGALLEALALGEDSPGAQAEALSASRAAFSRCLGRHGEPSPTELLPGATSWAARTRLATVDLLCGRPDEALTGFERAVRENPQLSEAHLGRLEALLDLGMAGKLSRGSSPGSPAALRTPGPSPLRPPLPWAAPTTPACSGNGPGRPRRAAPGPAATGNCAWRRSGIGFPDPGGGSQDRPRKPTPREPGPSCGPQKVPGRGCGPGPPCCNEWAARGSWRAPVAAGPAVPPSDAPSPYVSSTMIRRLAAHSLAALLAGLVLISATASAQQKRVYLAADDKSDLFWTADEATYLQAFVDTIDYYLDRADATIAAGEPSAFQSRWNCDGSLWMWTYERRKSAADFAASDRQDQVRPHQRAAQRPVREPRRGPGRAGAARDVLPRPHRARPRPPLPAGLHDREPDRSRWAWPRCGPAPARAGRGTASATATPRCPRPATASTTSTAGSDWTARAC